jgi:hypothetical protein
LPPVDKGTSRFDHPIDVDGLGLRLLQARGRSASYHLVRASRPMPFSYLFARRCENLEIRALRAFSVNPLDSIADLWN